MSAAGDDAATVLNADQEQASAQASATAGARKKEKYSRAARNVRTARAISKGEELCSVTKTLENERSDAMFLNLIQKVAGNKETTINQRRRFRPGIEGLENRISLSGGMTMPSSYTNGFPSPSPRQPR